MTTAVANPTPSKEASTLALQAVVRTDHPSAARWIGQNAERALFFSADIAGRDESARVFNDFVIQIAGQYLWECGKPIPNWSELNVRGLQRSIVIERLGLDDDAAGNFTITLLAFYAWLAHAGQVPRKRALEIMRFLYAYYQCYARKPLAPARRYLEYASSSRSRGGQPSPAPLTTRPE